MKYITAHSGPHLLYMRNHKLIVGGAGFVGSNLVIAFKEWYPGCRVTAIDNLSRKRSAFNLRRLQHNGFEFRQADTRYASALFTPYISNNKKTTAHRGWKPETVQDIFSDICDWLRKEEKLLRFLFCNATKGLLRC